jgi:hypothetical protein
MIDLEEEDEILAAHRREGHPDTRREALVAELREAREQAEVVTVEKKALHARIDAEEAYSYKLTQEIAYEQERNANNVAMKDDEIARLREELNAPDQCHCEYLKNSRAEIARLTAELAECTSTLRADQEELIDTKAEVERLETGNEAQQIFLSADLVIIEALDARAKKAEAEVERLEREMVVLIATGSGSRGDGGTDWKSEAAQIALQAERFRAAIEAHLEDHISGNCTCNCEALRAALEGK